MVQPIKDLKKYVNSYAVYIVSMLSKKAATHFIITETELIALSDKNKNLFRMPFMLNVKANAEFVTYKIKI